MNKENIYELEPSELAKSLEGPSFRATQVLNWVYKKNITDFKEMSNLPKEYREQLSEKFTVGSFGLLRKEISSDGSEKYLFGLKDGKTVETVLLKMKEDEYDEEEDIDFRQLSRHTWTVRALASIEDFNEAYGTHFSDEEVDTIGGLVMQAFGHLPARGESIDIDGYQFKVAMADSRRIIQVHVKLPDDAPQPKLED